MKCQGCQSVKAQVWVAESEAALCNGCSYVMGDVTRFRLCALCDNSPARIFCHNDNAALCDACDADIHLSNPLALRHDRVPLEPITSESVKVRRTMGHLSSTHFSTDSTLCRMGVTQPEQ